MSLEAPVSEFCATHAHFAKPSQKINLHVLEAALPTTMIFRNGETRQDNEEFRQTLGRKL